MPQKERWREPRKKTLKGREATKTMENYKKDGNYSAEGRKLRPRKKVSFNDNSSEQRSFGERSERRSYGNGGGNGERKSYGERRSFGERKSFSERRSYGNDQRRSFNGGEGSERRSYGENRNYGERRSYGNDQRRSYNGGEGSERRSFGEHRSYGENRSVGERRSFGERKSYGGNDQKRPYKSGERKGGFSNGRSQFNAGKGGRGGFNQKKSGGFRKKNEFQFDESAASGINQMISRKPQLDNASMSDFDYVPAPIKNEIRLNKFIANSGVCSRREADTFIEAGVVTVNGEVVTELGSKVNPSVDDVRFNGERLKGEEKVYIVMNKPKGFVTTSSDPHAEKTVMDLLKGCPTRVFPVGRLDKNTTGVLMFTNDGEIAEKLTHPSYDKKKIYQVLLDHELSQEDFDKIMAGVTLNDGDVAADELEYIDEKDHRKIGIEIHSGKNRIVRRIFESLGYDVRALDRVYFAGLTKKGVSKGEWRYLSEGEVNILRMGAYL